MARPVPTDIDVGVDTNVFSGVNATIPSSEMVLEARYQAAIAPCSYCSRTFST